MGSFDLVFIGEGTFTVKFVFNSEEPANMVVDPETIGKIKNNSEVDVSGHTMNGNVTLSQSG